MGVSRPGPQGFGPIWRRKDSLEEAGSNRRRGGRKEGARTEIEHSAKAFLQSGRTYDVGLQLCWARAEEEGNRGRDRKGNGRAGRGNGVVNLAPRLHILEIYPIDPTFRSESECPLMVLFRLGTL